MQPPHPLAFATALQLCLAACSAPSDDSRYLTKVVVPKLTTWATGPEPALDLSKDFIARDYDHICLVGEYTSLNIIERNLGFEITDYHSDFGTGVPELKWAIVVVRRGEAHAALGDGSKVNLNLVPGSLCASAQRAKLTRFSTENPTSKSVGLEVSDANKSGNRDENQ